MSDSDFADLVGTSPRVAGNSVSPGKGGYPGLPPQDPVMGGPASAWARSRDLFYGVPEAMAHIPAGAYRLGFHPNYGPCLNQIKLENDALVALPDSVTAEVVEEVRKFRTLRERFREFGFLHKRGVMLWGPPGGGKTVAIAQVTEIVVGGEGGIAALVDDPEAAVQCLQLVRRIEPQRPILGILEDIDALVDRHGEAPYLALLDGEAQIDNVVYLATTNYPERLSDRFSDRPSRFDTVRYVGMPTAQARKLYLEAKCPYLNGQADHYVQVSEGFSIAHLRELVVLTQCFGYDVDTAVGRLQRMRKAKPNSDRTPDYAGAGFGGR